MVNTCLLYLLEMHVLNLLLDGRQLRQRARQLGVLLGLRQLGQAARHAARHEGQMAAVLEQGLGGAVQATQLVVQLVYHALFFFKPAILCGFELMNKIS